MDVDEKFLLEKNLLDSYITAKFNEISKPLDIDIANLKGKISEIENKLGMIYKITVGVFVGVTTLIVFNLIRFVH